MNAKAFGACLVFAALFWPRAAPAADTPADAGRSIYLEGLLGSGAPLTARRSENSGVRGAAAACTNCHQRSGLGAREGRSVVPPIAARYLMRKIGKDDDDRNIPFVEGMRGERAPYTDQTLARAIREGVDSEGRALSYLMPRYELGDADMAALIGYLKRLDRRKVPGVGDTTLHLATIITPDADPVKRRGMLDVMTQFFTDRNDRQMATAPPLRSSGKTAYARSMNMVSRRWELHVWELTGPASTWQQQLERRLVAEPVFAVISGLGGSNWAPVHAFCEHSAVPCLFPNVEVPVDDDNDFYSIYFSKGVLLEAELIASRLLDAGDGGVARSVTQVYRAGDSGEAGAQALAALLERRGVRVVARALPAVANEESLAEAVQASAAADALVLWLRPADIAALGSPPSASTAVYMSGVLGGLERAPLPSGWRAATRLTYPYDLPDRRRVRVDYAFGWFTLRKIPMVAAQVQADTYLACGLLSETLQHMVDNFVREFLVERVRDTLEHRILTGYYPRLTLGTGQRFASKGGYLVRFADEKGSRVVADRDWIVP